MGGLAQVAHGVGEEADGAAAGRALLAQLGAVLGGVQPALIHAVGVGAGVAAQADAALVVGAGDGQVLHQARVAPPRVLGGVGEGAAAPVVHAPLSTPLHLELKHSKLVCGVLWGIELVAHALLALGGEGCRKDLLAEGVLVEA